MKYRITHTTRYGYSSAVPVCHNLVRLTPRSLEHQTCNRFQLLVHPEPTELTHREDYFGNQVSYFSIDQAHHGLTVSATSEVEVRQRSPRRVGSTAWEDVVSQLQTDRSKESLEAYQFSVPSRHVKPLPELESYTRRSFRRGRPVVEAVLELTTRIHREFTYDSKATTIQTPIEEVFKKRRGVCQDFAHLQIACLRTLGIPARYVSGYLRTFPPPGKPRLVGADASHAWLAAWCGKDGWIDVDPTNDMAASTDHVTVAWGRDFSDVSPIQGVIIGGGEHKMDVSVDVAPVNGLSRRRAGSQRRRLRRDA